MEDRCYSTYISERTVISRSCIKHVILFFAALALKRVLLVSEKQFAFCCCCDLYHIEMSIFIKNFIYESFSSVQFSCSVVSNSLRPHESQHARPPCLSPTLGVHSDSRQQSTPPKKCTCSYLIPEFHSKSKSSTTCQLTLKR